MSTRVHALLGTMLLASVPTSPAAAQARAEDTTSRVANVAGDYRLTALAGVPLPAPIPDARRQARPERPCLGSITGARVIGGVLQFRDDGTVAYADTVEVDCRRLLGRPHTYASPRLTLTGTYATAGADVLVRLGDLEVRASRTDEGRGLMLRAGAGAGAWVSEWRRADVSAATTPVVATATGEARPGPAGPSPSPVVGSPTVQRTADGPALSLPTAMTAVLREWNPEFRPFGAQHYAEYMRPGRESEGVPWAIVADLDGDRLDDVALLGRAGARDYLVAVLTGPDGPRVAVVYDVPAEPSSDGHLITYLSVVRPGVHGGGCGDGPSVTTSTMAIGTGEEGKGGATVYYLDGEKFASVYDGC